MKRRLANVIYEKEQIQSLLDEYKFEYQSITSTVRRDREFTSLITKIKDVESFLTQTERERKKQQEAIFGVMSMINIAGGMLPVQQNAEC